jgi:diaminohydroxyphosphoribosylaminopyrimidine deaminase/5-amino-6-(5-phosphoribosylamino)uracil reductase
VTADERTAAADNRYMQMALALARRGLGVTWPNPTVGCVLVDDHDELVGRGWTQPGGRPHAETEALKRAGGRAQGATLYTTLEPCIHHGETPPCVDAILQAGVRRVVIALEDPDRRVAGRGARALAAAGLQVTVGVQGVNAAEINVGFVLRNARYRPLLTLKLASSLDGRIATAEGESRWITGSESRALVHRLRSTQDGILVGATTARHDDPELTCRLPGLHGRSPLRLVADPRCRLPLTSKLVQMAQCQPTWLLIANSIGAARRAEYEAAGVRLMAVDCTSDGVLDPRAMAQALGRAGLTRVLIEGGGRLAASFISAGLVDHIVWFHAPAILGADARAAAGALAIRELAHTPRFKRIAVRSVGPDVVEFYSRED